MSWERLYEENILSQQRFITTLLEVLLAQEYYYVQHLDSNKDLSQETPYQWHYFDSFARYTFLYPKNTSHDFYRSLKTSECNLSAFMIRQQIEFETK